MIRSMLVLAVFASLLSACSSDPVAADPPSVLDGLVQSVARDSAGTQAPFPEVPTGPGEVHGTVLAPSPGGGGDTLQTAPRIAGVVVTAYPVMSSGSLELGPAAASVVTGTDGRFDIPTLPAGEYVVTVEPPAPLAATYYGQWLRGSVYAGSGSHPWWLVLARR